MAATLHLLVWSFTLFGFSPLIASYKISTVDSPNVCNDTIYLEEGDKSAAILKLTTKDSYELTPQTCIITFKAVQHKHSGLTGVLEEVDLRRFDDTADHHLAQDECVDYIKVLQDTGPNFEQCGSWKVKGTDKLSNLGPRRSLFGYCQNPAVSDGAMRCGVYELRVEVSIGKKTITNMRKDKPWRSYRGFTFVVTAYKYSIGESKCPDDFQSCGEIDSQHQCVHNAFWCDNHINCGQLENRDELMCHNNEMLSGLVTVMVGPWVGAALLVVLVLAGVLYWRRARPPPPPGPPQPQDHNSYAESYEVSSTMSSAHHMAIQVRVVCNSGHGLHTPRLSPWTAADLPPSYDSLFPGGPPAPKSTSSATLTTNTTNAPGSFNISTTSLVSASIGSNNIPTSSGAGPSGFYSNTTQTSNIVIPINAICNTRGSSPSMSSASFSTTNTVANSMTSVTPTYTNTTSTTTFSTVRASPPTAMASISVTSTSTGGPSGNLMAIKNKDISGTSPSHDSKSNNSSRAVTPNNYPKAGSSGEASSCTIEAMPPLVEPEDTNITPCNSAGDTPASSDVQLPYNFQQNANAVNDLQACDKLPLSIRSRETTQEFGHRKSIASDVVCHPSMLSASCSGSYDCDTPERPGSESEETEEITLDDEEVSRSAIIRNFSEEDENTSSASYLHDRDYLETETSRPLLLNKTDEDSISHENTLDKDDESLL